MPQARRYMKLHFVLNQEQHSELTKKQEARNRAAPRFLSLGWLCHYLAITPKEELLAMIK